MPDLTPEQIAALNQLINTQQQPATPGETPAALDPRRIPPTMSPTQWDRRAMVAPTPGQGAAQFQNVLNPRVAPNLGMVPLGTNQAAWTQWLGQQDRSWDTSMTGMGRPMNADGTAVDTEALLARLTPEEVRNLTPADRAQIGATSLTGNPISNFGLGGPQFTGDWNAYITDIYQRGLGRAPEAGAVDHWAQHRDRQHLTADQLMWRMLESGRLNNEPAFANGPALGAQAPRFEGNWGNHIGDLYRYYLGRSPGETELAHWETQRVNNQMTPAQLASSIIGSGRAQGEQNLQNQSADDYRNYIGQVYQNYFGRPADELGLNHWVSQQQTNKWTPEQTLEAILSTGEKNNEYPAGWKDARLSLDNVTSFPAPLPGTQPGSPQQPNPNPQQLAPPQTPQQPMPQQPPQQPQSNQQPIPSPMQQQQNPPRIFRAQGGLGGLGGVSNDQWFNFMDRGRNAVAGINRMPFMFSNYAAMPADYTAALQMLYPRLQMASFAPTTPADPNAPPTTPTTPTTNPTGDPINPIIMSGDPSVDPPWQWPNGLPQGFA